MAEQSWWEEELTKHWGTGETTHETRRAAKTALGEIERLRTVAVGANAGAEMVLVPREPTMEMARAWDRAYNGAPEGSGHAIAWDEAYDAMLEAALAARADARADEPSDEKSADTPVT